MPNQTATVDVEKYPATIDTDLDFGERYQVSFKSSLGPIGKRHENQDNYLVIDIHGRAEYLQKQHPQRINVNHWPYGHIRLAVLDGMGRHKFGREVAERITKGLLSIPACHSQLELNHALTNLHQQIRKELASLTDNPTGATLLLLEIPMDKPAMLFHVGDSRLYKVSESQVTCLTLDHAPATTYMLQGQLTFNDWYKKVHLQNCIELTQAFAMGNHESDELKVNQLHEIESYQLPELLEQMADRRTIKLEPDQMYILATDGFWAYKSPQNFIQQWPAILKTTRGSANHVESLLNKLFQNHESFTASENVEKDDNSTAILIIPTQFS